MRNVLWAIQGASILYLTECAAIKYARRCEMATLHEYAKWFCEQIEKDNSLENEPCTSDDRMGFQCDLCPRLNLSCTVNIRNRIARYRYFKGVCNAFD